jgi:hypothetical protein
VIANLALSDSFHCVLCLVQWREEDLDFGCLCDQGCFDRVPWTWLYQHWLMELLELLNAKMKLA